MRVFDYVQNEDINLKIHLESRSWINTNKKKLIKKSDCTDYGALSVRNRREKEDRIRLSGTIRPYLDDTVPTIKPLENKTEHQKSCSNTYITFLPVG